MEPERDDVRMQSRDVEVELSQAHETRWCSNANWIFECMDLKILNERTEVLEQQERVTLLKSKQTTR